MSWGIYARYETPRSYVLLAVDGGNEKLPSRLISVPVGRIWIRSHEPQHWDTWYGGNFDLVLLTESAPVISPNFTGTEDGRACSIGDERAVLVTSLTELLEYGARLPVGVF